MGQRKFSHFVVKRGDVPCVLLVNPAFAPKGVLAVATEGQAATRFICDRSEKYPTIYGRRRALYAINRTQRFIESTSGSLIDQHEFVKTVMAGEGPWAIEPVLCESASK